MFYPERNTLTFSEHLAGLSPFTTPIIRVSDNPQLAYNLAFLCSFFLSALFAHLLCFRLTKRHDAALITGLAFAFAPYRMSQLAHLQVLTSFWMPLALAGLHAYLADRRARSLGLFGIAFLLQGLSNGYYLLFFPVLVGLWIVWFVSGKEALKTVAMLGAPSALVMLVTLPFLLTYNEVHAEFGFRRGPSEIESYSADLSALVRADSRLAVWERWLPPAKAEAQLFPGVTVMLLVTLAAVRSLRRRTEVPAKRSLARMALAGVAVLYTLVVLSLATVGPWRFSLLGLTVRATSIDKPLSVALVGWLGVGLMSSRFRDALRRRSPFAFYVGATGLMWLLSFGPSPTLLDTSVLYRAPYAWLLTLPGFDGLRVPARFTMLATLCLSVAAGLAVARLTAPYFKRRLVVVGLAAAGILVDGWIAEMPIVRAPTPSILAADATPGAVMELPLGDTWQDLTAIYRSMRHRHPLVNGYSGYEPPHYDALRVGLQLHDQSILATLASLGTRYVIVNQDRDPDKVWSDYVAAQPRARLISTGNGQQLYELDHAAPLFDVDGGRPVEISWIRVNVDEGNVAKLTDGDPQSRWTTGPQQGTEEVLVKLDRVRGVGAVELWLGPYGRDFPRELRIDISTDGVQWRPVWQGLTAGAAMAAALEDPRTLPLRLSFEPLEAGYIRLRQLGQDPVYYWSATELRVRSS
jgi:hypothetical protein